MCMRVCVIQRAHKKKEKTTFNQFQTMRIVPCADAVSLTRFNLFSISLQCFHFPFSLHLFTDTACGEYCAKEVVFHFSIIDLDCKRGNWLEIISEMRDRLWKGYKDFSTVCKCSDQKIIIGI